jgi:hypothetical protein
VQGLWLSYQALRFPGRRSQAEIDPGHDDFPRKPRLRLGFFVFVGRGVREKNEGVQKLMPSHAMAGLWGKKSRRRAFMCAPIKAHPLHGWVFLLTPIKNAHEMSNIP